jgi:hypothetical protein
MVPRIVAVDFDGTLFDFAYPGIGPVKPGGKEALQRFKDLGYKVLIYSCRTCKHYPEIFSYPGEVLDMNRKVVRDMIEALDLHEIPYDSIDDGTMGKPMADFYCDDKGIRFNNNWDEISDFIAAFGPV